MHAHKLLLIRHSQSLQDPSVPASQWGLTGEGQRRCDELADRLAVHHPVALVTSRERKAAETGRLVAERLELPCQSAEGLHEHQRERVVYSSPEVFERSVRLFFDRPDELVFGEETARAAERRFEGAVRAVLARYAAGNVAIVSHGTVITLFVARHTGLAPIPFWKNLSMPALVVLSLPDLRPLEVS
jgi:broad specificity phosphatase PhoE